MDQLRKVAKPACSWSAVSVCLVWSLNRVMSEMVLDGGGHFIPAGIFGLHTLSLLFSSQAAHDRAAEGTREHTI